MVSYIDIFISPMLTTSQACLYGGIRDCHIFPVRYQSGIPARVLRYAASSRSLR